MATRSQSQARGRKPGRPTGSQTGTGEGRDALLRAARALMAERGMARVTVREVADRAGVQSALVHYYFGNKDGLLRAVVEEVAAGLRERIAHIAAIDGTPEERLRAFVSAFVSAMAADPYAPRLIVEQVLFAKGDVLERFASQFARPNLEVMLSVLEDGRETGSLRPVDPRFFMPATIGSTLFYFLAAPLVARLFGLDSVAPERTEEFADSVAELLLHGIATNGDSKT